MSPEQRLLERATAPGDSYWYQGECIRKPYAPVDKWSFNYDELMSCPDTPRMAYLRARYPLAGVATVGMRRAS